MTRDEHLVFCKKCLNREFDPQQGIICKETMQKADFEVECEIFERDESVKEEIPEEVKSNVELIAELSEDIKEKFRHHQNMEYAVIGGLFLSIICALIWAVITVTTEYQISYMAIGVGIIVGMGVRFFGAGIDVVYGFIGAILALFGCVLGNLFSQAGFIAQAESLGYLDTLTLLNFDAILLIFQESFSPMDILFYGFAIYGGYKFAFRPIPEDVAQRQDLTPTNANLRLPLVISSFIIISVTGFTLSRGVNGYQTFYYESGEVMSTGEYVNGKEHGKWEYFYENGNLQAKAAYDHGIENGDWEWYHEEGQLMRKATFKQGHLNGIWLNYYENGVLSDSTNYTIGRLNGESISYYENGQISQHGNYIRDRQDGHWKIYYDNGQLSAEGEYTTAEPVGLWKYWSQEGKPLQELEYDNSPQLKIINSWDQNSEFIIKNGFGDYESHYENGTILETGQVKDGNRVGTWKIFYSNGKLKEESTYEEGIRKVINTWSVQEGAQVRNGEGEYLTFFENSTDTFEKGLIKNGLKEGQWFTYHENSNVVMQESFYTNGKLNGQSVTYYLNGGIYTEGSYENDKKVGEWTWHYESGQIQCVVAYINDKKEGAQLFLSETGQQNKEELYKEGQFISERVLQE